MAFFNGWPWTQFQEHNLDWIIKKLKDLENQIIETDEDPVARAGVAANAQAISDLTTTVSNNKTTAHNEALAASNAAGTAQTTADGAVARLDRMEIGNRKFIFIGDSYDAGWTPDGDVTGWGDRAAAELGKTMNVDCWNQYYGGAGFGFANDNPMSFYYQLESVITSLSASEKASITDVVIAGGRNDDSQANATINNGITACMNLVANNLPNAHGWIFAIGWDGNPGVRKGLVEHYFECYSRTVAAKHWKYVPLYYLLHDRSFLASDLKHPNNDGNYLLGNQIAAILCGSVPEQASIRYPVTLYGTGTGAYAFRNGNMVTLLLPQVYIPTASGVSHTTYTDTGAILQTRPIFGQAVNNPGGFALNVILQTTANEFYETMVFARIIQQADGTMTLALKHHAMNKDNTAYVVDANINQVMIAQQQITLPIEWA